MKQAKTLNTFVVIFFVVLAAWILTYIVPVGKFDVLENYVWDPQRMELDERVSIDPDSFEFLSGAGGRPQTRGVPLFGAYHGVGLFNYVFQGIVDSASIVVFILVIGGAFGIIIKTGAIEAAMHRVIQRLRGARIAFIPVLFLIFSFAGATFGMGEEAIPFAMIVIPIVVALGYDAITGVLVTYGATQIGFASSWMNPFSIAIAQGIAGIPVLSGLGYRVLLFILFTLLGTGFTMWYARKIAKDPESSLSWESDAYFRDQNRGSGPGGAEQGFTTGHALVLLIVLAGIIWVALGVTLAEYYIPEIATQFFIMGLLAGVIGVIFKLNGMSVSVIAESFVSGARDLLGAALIVGMAKGILIILTLGGDPGDPTAPNMLNTILYGAGNGLRQLPRVLSAWVMYLFQAAFNFFVPSGSGKAALTMPLMAPLAQYAGVSRQVSVLAFQLGDGFTNMIVPTSAALMGVLAVARLDWLRWVKSQLALQSALFVLSTLAIVFAVLGGAVLGPDWTEAGGTASLSAPGELSAASLDGVYRLEAGERLRISVPVETGQPHEIILVDSYNRSFYENTLPEEDAIRALVFRAFTADGSREYSDSYAVQEAGGGVTPESADAAAQIIPEDDRIVLEIEGYQSSYAGALALVVTGPRGSLDPSLFSSRKILSTLPQGSPLEFRIGRLEAGQQQTIEFRTEPGTAYRLYLVDSYNNRQNAYVIPQSEVLRAYQFHIYEADGQTPYPRSVYQQYDEDKAAGVAPLGNEVDIAPPAAVFTASAEVTVVDIRGYNDGYAGSYAYALLEGDYRLFGDEPGEAPDGVSISAAGLLASRGGAPVEARTGEWIASELAAGQARLYRFSVEPGVQYGLFVADSYSAEVLSVELNTPVQALWFALFDEDGLLDADVYAEPEYTGAYDADGGYSATDNEPSARVIPGSSSLTLYIEGSKEEYSGQFALRLERLP